MNMLVTHFKLTLQKWWPWRKMLVNVTWRHGHFSLLYYRLPITDFHKHFPCSQLNIAIKQQQYCNTVRPQLNSDRFTHHMTSQTWRLYFEMNSSYFSQILWYKRYLVFVANGPSNHIHQNMRLAGLIAVCKRTFTVFISGLCKHCCYITA